MSLRSSERGAVAHQPLSAAWAEPQTNEQQLLAIGQPPFNYRERDRGWGGGKERGKEREGGVERARERYVETQKERDSKTKIRSCF